MGESHNVGLLYEFRRRNKDGQIEWDGLTCTKWEDDCREFRHGDRVKSFSADEWIELRDSSMVSMPADHRRGMGSLRGAQQYKLTCGTSYDCYSRYDARDAAESLGAVEFGYMVYEKQRAWDSGPDLRTEAYFDDKGLEVVHWASIMDRFTVLPAPRAWCPELKIRHNPGPIRR